MEGNNKKISDLIRETGLSKSYIYSVLANNSVPSLVNARKIAYALNVDIEDIFPSNLD